MGKRTLCYECGVGVDVKELERRIRWSGRGGIVLCTLCRRRNRHEKISADVELDLAYEYARYREEGEE